MMSSNAGQECPLRSKVLSYGFVKLFYGLLSIYFLISEIFGILFASNNSLGPIVNLASLPQLIIFRSGWVGLFFGFEILFSSVVSICASRGVFTGVANKDKHLLQTTSKMIILLAITLGLMGITVWGLFYINYDRLNSLIFEYIKTMNIGANKINYTESAAATISTLSSTREDGAKLNKMIIMYVYGIGIGIDLFLGFMVVILIFDIKTLQLYLFYFDDQYLTKYGIRTEMAMLMKNRYRGYEIDEVNTETIRLISDV